MVFIWHYLFPKASVVNVFHVLQLIQPVLDSVQKVNPGVSAVVYNPSSNPKQFAIQFEHKQRLDLGGILNMPSIGYKVTGLFISPADSGDAVRGNLHLEIN